MSDRVLDYKAILAGRLMYKVDLVNADYGQKVEVRNRVTDPREATLIGSWSPGGAHLPAIDLDYAARLIPSKTPGHFHLYLDRPVSWYRYKKLLRALKKAGLIDPGFCNLSIKRGQSYLRVPWRT